MLTITDFIKVLTKFSSMGHTAGCDHSLSDIETHKISTWRSLFPENNTPLVYISSENTVLQAVELLLKSRVHRLPVMDIVTGNALYILTHKRILKFLHLYMKELPVPSFMNQTLEQLQLGSFKDIKTVHQTTPLLTALHIFLKNRVSALPVLDDKGAVVDIYAKFDAINLAASRTYDNLDITVVEALQYRRATFGGVSYCRKTTTLMRVVSQIVHAEVHRLIITNNEIERRCIGIISLSDILRFFLQSGYVGSVKANVDNTMDCN
jgi:5'-AMP-activated protein kinase regulatory gamma subunit